MFQSNLQIAMIYPDLPNFTLLIEKIEIMIIADILVRTVSMNGRS